MDKAILRKFAIESRKDLMEKIKNKVNTFYVDEDFKNEQKGDLYTLSNEKHSLSLTNDEYKKRELLIKRIKELSLEQVIEEAAYTWFNRIIAIRYMEINDMLPLTKDNQSLGIRVLSSKDNTPDPEILKFTNLVNPDLDIDFKKEKYAELKDDNEKFKYVLLLVCKKLGRVIPQVFDGITDYIDILIPDNLLNDTGFITKIINDVPENNYNQVEIIGWLYQYYNQLEKDRVISAKKTYKKNEIAYATQLFTPDWIVKYMVENSLGKYWVEHSENNISSRNWKYFISENIEKKGTANLKEITFIDPCCGSGHILVYAFDIFYKIYSELGYKKDEIPELILKNNIYGLDIDDRAGQLSILSIILKAREFDKNIFNKEIVKNINVLSIQESNTISHSLLDEIKEENNQKTLQYLLETFNNAKEIGSLLKIKNYDYSNLKKEITNNSTIFGIELREKVIPLIKIAKILLNKYTIVVTNPPYMNNSVMSPNLKTYVESNYKDVKGDLFSSFIIKNEELCAENGLLGFMTPFVWMFISSYEKLRNNIIEKCNISSLIQMEYSSFEEATVPICSFVLEKRKLEKSIFINLTNYTGGMKVQENKYLEAIRDKKDIYYKDISIFNKISSSPIIYWASNELIDIFEKYPIIGENYDAKVGIQTGNNDKFLRLWYEVEKNKISKKWFNHNKGGEFRKWYGNREYVINYENDGYELKNYKINGRLASRPQNLEYNFRKSISWNLITSGTFSARYFDESFTFNVAAPCCFPDDDNLYYILGLFNTKVIQNITKMLNPTLNMKTGDISKIPLIIDSKQKEKINSLVEENISISKEDWDSFETSWDFIKHLLLTYQHLNPQMIQREEKNGFLVENTLEEAFNNWQRISKERFEKVKSNEEELNKIFIDIYGLQDELTPEVENKDITIRKADKEREIKSLISYAVGCMFGRYSLDKNGLIYAGGDFDSVYQKFKKKDGGWAGASLSNYKVLNDNGNEIELSFEVDNDNVIPITDEAYFGDDIVERFKKFIKIAYGENNFNENIDFIAETLGKKGTETSEDTIRRYFLNDFFNDHCKIYQKRPIYWLFDSGKKNGFKALVYMHRYNENLIPKVRLDYLHRVQTTYEKLLSDVNYKLTTDLSMTDKKAAQNRQADLNAKLNEIKEYDEKIAHIANQRISIDLDDGVKENYEKFKDILAKIK